MTSFLYVPKDYHHRVPNSKILLSVSALSEEGNGGPKVSAVRRVLDVIADGGEHVVGVVDIVAMVQQGLKCGKMKKYYFGNI